ncbi:MAG: hypothetical protein MPW16_15175 [Candidatus Manganitrophus sp.]|nr:MAG: hypothetical protein MPW16_15175 [Candidatus Manganitrophus sp.]
MELLSDSVAVNSGEETVVDLEIPAGPARQFVVTAFDVENTPRFRGEETVDLVPGSSASIRISMVEIGVTVPLRIQISPKTTALTRSRPNNPVAQTFTLVNAKNIEVDLFVNEQLGGTTELGKTGLGETEDTIRYIAPERIPIDRTNTALGVPIPITVEAVDKADPNRRDSAHVAMVTELQLEFGRSIPVGPTTTGQIATESAGQRSIAFYHGKVFAVWSQFINQQERWMAFFSESTDGLTWNNPVPLFDQDRLEGYEPSITIGADGTIYVALTISDCLFCSGSVKNVQLLARAPGATGFSPFLGPIDAGTAFNLPTPSVAVSPNGTVFVAWSAPNDLTGSDIFFQRINKEGDPIDATPQNLTEQNGANSNETQPTLSIRKEGEIYIAWEVFPNVVATVSLDGGNTFLPGVPVNTPSIDEPAFSPSLVAGPENTVYVAWERDDCGDGCTFIFFNVGKVETNELKFGPEKPVGSAVGGRQNQPSIAWDGSSGIYIGFQEFFSGGTGIFLAKSINEGGAFTFSRIDAGAPQSASSSFPSIEVDRAGRTFAIWTRFLFINQTSQWNVLFAMGDDPTE